MPISSPDSHLCFCLLALSQRFPHLPLWVKSYVSIAHKAWGPLFLCFPAYYKGYRCTTRWRGTLGKVQRVLTQEILSLWNWGSIAFLPGYQVGSLSNLIFQEVLWSLTYRPLFISRGQWVGCSARCPNPWAGREKASKTVQFTKREVYYWLESGLSAATNAVAQGQIKPWEEAVTQIYKVCISG